MRHQIAASEEKKVIVYPSVIIRGQVECMVTNNGIVQSCFTMDVHQAVALAGALSLEAERIECERVEAACGVKDSECPCGIADSQRPCFCTMANSEIAASRRAVRG